MPFAPGQSGNPGGRPKENAEVKALARSHGKAALEKIVALMSSADERIALAASQTLLDRGFGKPTQPLSGDDEMPALKVEGAINLVRPASEG